MHVIKKIDQGIKKTKETKRDKYNIFLTSISDKAICTRQVLGLASMVVQESGFQIT